MKKSVDGLVDRGQISRGLIAPSCSDGRKNGSVSGPSSSCRNYFLQTNALVIFLRISATWLIIPFSLSNRLIALSTCLHSFRVCLFTLFFSSFLIVFFCIGCLHWRTCLCLEFIYIRICLFVNCILRDETIGTHIQAVNCQRVWIFLCIN